MNRKLTLKIVGSLIILALIVGCTASTPTLTLTFDQNKCSYSGPKAISAEKLNVDLVLPELNPQASGFALVTLDSGKTIADLEAWPSTDPPDWLTVLSDAGEISKNASINIDLAPMMAFHTGDALYLVCFQKDSNGIVNKIGAFGPIKTK